MNTGFRARAYAAAGLVAFWLKFKGPEKILKAFSRPLWRFLFRSAGIPKERLLQGVRSVLARHPLCGDGKDCLIRCLVLYGFLKPLHPDLRLVMGVGKAPSSEWEGHSWLESGGDYFFPAERNAQRFRRLKVLG